MLSHTVAEYMNSGHRVDTSVEFSGISLLSGVGGGLIGGVAMGIILYGGANLMPFIGALYGAPTEVGGWIAHLINSVLIGLLFAVIVSQPIIRERMKSMWDYIVAGVIYAAAVGLVTTGILLPLSMNLLGVQSLPDPLYPLPEFMGTVLVVLSVGVAHVVYGFLLGTAYWWLGRVTQ